MNDNTTPGEDFLDALLDELAEYNDGDTEAEHAKEALGHTRPWRQLSAKARAIFERAALRFLSE